eukprot:COSAG01_NODE_257_length_20101_cov_142.726427_8_plen_272_part_00
MNGYVASPARYTRSSMHTHSVKHLNQLLTSDLSQLRQTRFQRLARSASMRMQGQSTAPDSGQPGPPVRLTRTCTLTAWRNYVRVQAARGAMAVTAAALALAHSLLLLPVAALTTTTKASAAGKPHVFFLLIDDYVRCWPQSPFTHGTPLTLSAQEWLTCARSQGWAGAGWHNQVLSGGQREVQTPHMDKLVATGINLNQHYTFKFCSPTRSSLQSGRNPIHVNVQNVAPTLSNPADPVAGFSAIARNMTGMAVHMSRLGYATAAVGKWVSS